MAFNLPILSTTKLLDVTAQFLLSMLGAAALFILYQKRVIFRYFLGAWAACPQRGF